MSLSVLVYEPLVVGTSVLDDGLGFSINPQIVWTSYGGYWSFTFDLVDTQMRIEDWLMDGLGRHVEIYNPGLSVIWEGFVSTVQANIGSVTLTRGPLLDVTANRMRSVYSTVDTSTNPPTVGNRDKTAWFTNPASQTAFGEISRVLSVAGSSAANAAQNVQTALAEMAFPPTTQQDNIGSASRPSVSITCLGYIHWLDVLIPSLATTGLQNASTKIQAILATDPNGIFSTDYSLIDTNTTQVKAYEQREVTGGNLVKGIVSLGDSSFNRWTFGFYQNRRAVYQAIPTTNKYQRSVLDPSQSLEIFGSGAVVKPWNVQPAENVFYTDLFIGRQNTPGTDDPRQLFIEQAAFTAPWSLSLEGGKVNTLAQMLAQQGLGGTT
jgi:hypothetical protein